MRITLVALALYLLLPVFMLGQANASSGSNSSAKQNPPTIDLGVEWSALQGLIQPSRGNAVSVVRNATPEQKSNIGAQADQSRQVAAKAKEFYTRFPSHPNAGEARKIEALSELRGIKQGDVVHETKAIGLARAFRADRAQPQAARVEVALAMDRAELTRRVRSGEKALLTTERLRVGDQLRAEFGEIPEYHAYAMELARTVDSPTALRLATETSRSPVAPIAAKAQAAVVLDRAALLGKTINLRVAGVDSPDFDFAKPPGKTTFVVVWSPGDPVGLVSLGAWSKVLTGEAQIVYLAVGGSPAQIRKAKTKTLPAGLHCHAPSGPASRATFDALKLRYASLPRIYAFDAQGRLAALGSVDELPAVFARVAVLKP